MKTVKWAAILIVLALVALGGFDLYRALGRFDYAKSENQIAERYTRQAASNKGTLIELSFTDTANKHRANAEVATMNADYTLSRSIALFVSAGVILVLLIASAILQRRPGIRDTTHDGHVTHA